MILLRKDREFKHQFTVKTIVTQQPYFSNLALSQVYP